jgi:transmembrane sensor
MDIKNKNKDPIALLPKVFSGEATADEKKLVEDWSSSGSANRKDYDDFAKLWEMTGNVSSGVPVNLDAEWHKLDSAITPERAKVITLTRILQIAASVIVITALTFLGQHLAGVSTLKAPVNASSVATLADGSVITLNAGSKISYKKGFGMLNRNILLSGEAYFEVAKNENLPFIINAGDVCIQVTGTKFNIKAYKKAGHVEVMVTEGAVKLYNVNQPVIETTLGAGETGLYNLTSHAVEKKPTLNLNNIAWKTGIMDFHNTPLDEVADILSGTYRQSITVDTVLKQCTVTVRFENQKLDSVLSVLQSTLDLEIVTKGKRTIISGKGC